jgi:hypothetical protein
MQHYQSYQGVGNIIHHQEAISPKASSIYTPLLFKKSGGRAALSKPKPTFSFIFKPFV